METKTNSTTRDLRKVAQWFFLLWAVVASLLAFVPAIILLTRASPSPATQLPSPPRVPQIPSPPATLTPASRAAYETYTAALVDRYTKQVAAYKDHVTAYSSAVNAGLEGDLLTRYKVVVKDVLGELVKALLTAIVGWAFVKAAVDVAERYLQARQARP